MEQLNFAIIGGGNIGRVHIEAIARIPGARVAVICDISKERGGALAQTCSADWLGSFEETVSRADVDVVSICTPSGLHTEPAVAAARAGKHVLVEKPIDITLPRADRIIHAAQASGVKLGCILPSRFVRGVRHAKRALEEGRLGRLTLADAYVKWFRPQSYYEGSWHGTWKMDGGGALINQSIHSIDLLQWLAGPVESLFGQVGTLAHQMEAEDTGTAVLRYKNGAMGVIQGTTACWPGDEARLELHGERGTIFLKEGRISKWKLADAKPGEEEQALAMDEHMGSGAQDPMGIGYELHRRQIADFVAAIRENRAPEVDGLEGRKAIEIIRAIYSSAQSGKMITLPFEDVTA
jgi:predicted dehydrogenase